MAEDSTLPGMPKKRLVRDVKRHLRSFGIVPSFRTQSVWSQAWSWAADVARSYQRFDGALPKRLRARWPLATEIAAQNLVLLLAEIQESRMFRLPYRANRFLPHPLKKLTDRDHQQPSLLPLMQQENPKETSCRSD